MTAQPDAAGRSASHIDMNSLGWVLGEIRHMLTDSLQALTAFMQSGGEEAQLRNARNALHQAHGAIQIVGIDGVAILTEEVEHLYTLFEANPSSCTEAVRTAIQQAFDAIVDYLEELQRGAEHRPLRLFSYFRDLLVARGAERIHPADLFFPDLSLRPIKTEIAVALTPAVLGRERATFERALLHFLQDKNNFPAVHSMLSAVSTIEATQRDSTQWVFWWVSKAFLQALSENTLPTDLNVQRLCARINLQMRRLFDEAAPLAERLLKDTLFFVACSTSSHPLVRAVKQLYQLEGLVPADFATSRYRKTAVQLIAQLRDRLDAAKQIWNRLVGGNLSEAKAFSAETIDLQKTALELNSPGVTRLAEVLAEIAQRLQHSLQVPSQALGLDVATALLFLEASIENLDDDFNQRAFKLAQRLQASADGDHSIETLDWLDEISHQAQERLSLIGVLREIQNGLSENEKIIDNYFRAADTPVELSKCQNGLNQIAGALNMLGQTDAVNLVRRLQAQLEIFASAPATLAPNIFEEFAQEYGALGFLTEELLHNPEFAMLPYTYLPQEYKFVVPRARPFEALAASAGVLSASDEDLLLVSASHGLEVPMIGSDDQNQSFPTLTNVPADNLAGEVALARITSEQTMSTSPMHVDSQAETDAELLEIFLNEAHEVLAVIQAAYLVCQRVSTDMEQLTLIRRGFHTLKGSSRMVGLNQFGAAAWELEQTLNTWLSERRPASLALLQMLEIAQVELSDWVKELQQFGISTRTPDYLIELAQRVRMGQTLEDMPQTSSKLVVSAVQLAHAQAENTPIPTVGALEELSVQNNEAMQPSIAVTSHLSGAQKVVELPDNKIPETSTVSPISATVIDLVPPEPGALRRDDVVYVGEMPVSAPLYNIFLTEADDLIRQVEQDLAEWRYENRTVSFLVQRSMHSLAGIAATVGFKDLQSVAAAFEDGLALMAQHTLYPTQEEHEYFKFVVDQIRALLQQFSAGVLPPYPQALLDKLHEWHFQLNKLIDPSLALPDKQSNNPDAVESALDLLAAARFEETTSEHVSQEILPDRQTLAAPESLADTAIAQPTLAHEVAPRIPGELKLTDAIQDDIDPELLAIFIEEANDYLPQIGATLRAWQAAPTQSQHAQVLLRQMHTIKGSARMAGAMRMGQLIHTMETRVESVSALPVIPPSVSDDLLSAYDQSLQLFEQLINPNAVPAVIQAMPTIPETALEVKVHADLAPTEHAIALAPVLDPPAFTGVVATSRTPANPALHAQVRVRAELLDRLVNQAGEVSITRARVENEVATLRTTLTDLTENVSRLRAQLREIEIQAESQMQSQLTLARRHEGEFDPLEFDRFTRFQELTRMMAESVNDVATIQENLVRGVETAQAGLLTQARNARELQQDLMSVRMVPFGSISERLYRVVRQASKELDKRVNLDIQGTNVELDRSVLERMAAPFEHLLRNAVVHGIESRTERLTAGKSETGELKIEVRQEGTEVVMTFSDDGAGLNLGKIRTRALKQGLLTQEREISEREAADFIFMPGFSTAGEVTELAGRGVGMDVVKFEAAELGGRVDLDFTPGAGSRFTIHLPLTLAVTQVVLVRVGEKVYALPSVLVEQVQQLKPQALANAYNAGYIEWLGQRVAVRYLAALLRDLEQSPTAQRYSPLIVVRSGGQRLALHVDQILGNFEVVVKNIGPQVARVPGISGATVMGSGELVLILNPVQLLERAPAQVNNLNLFEVMPEGSVVGAGAIAEVLANNQQTTKVQGLNTTPIIMVVDDSLTVRRVTQRLLQREGYQVVLAKDGVDALQQIQDSAPDVMLVDIEMPRMDGFDLTRNIRADERLKTVPIIMITSRTAVKHRNYALSIGVNVYLGKPFQEDELLRHIANFVGERKPKIAHG